MAHTPARSVVFNRPQIGVEVTPGTPVAATKKLVASTIRLKPVIPTDPFRPGGNRFNTDSTPRKEHTTGTIEKARINLGGDITYWLSSLMRKAAAAGTWVFDPDPVNPNELETYTLERGTGTLGERASFIVCDSLSFRWSETESDVSGTLLGQQLTPGVTMATVGVTALTKALAIPGKTRISVGDASNNLTKLTEVLQADLNLGNYHAGQKYLDDADETFKKLKALAPNMTARLALENNSVASGMLTDLRSSALRFCQIISYGTYLVGNSGARYSMEALFPFKYADEDIQDVEDIDSGVFDLLPVHDETFGTAMKITVTNNQASL